MYAQDLIRYIRWHFGVAVKEIYERAKNLSWFFYHFFSIPLLAHTLVRPIYRDTISMRPGTGFRIDLFFQKIVTNTLSRLLGLLLRVIVIGVGLLCQVLVFCVGIIVILGWVLLPAVIPMLLVVSLQMIL